MLDYYYFYQEDNQDFCYTIDMLRLRTYIEKPRFRQLKDLFNRISDDWFPGDGFGKFADNWKFGTLWTGMGTKSKSKNSKIIWCIEFNPNKLDSSARSFLEMVLLSFDFDVVRYDLAIDFPFNINQLYFGDLYKKSFSMFYKSYDDKTYYFGKGNGHTKIYNKKIESNLDIELTRYEVTIETEFKLIDIDPPYKPVNFVTVCRTPYFSYSNDPSLDAILYAVNSGFPFKSLSRRYKDYIKKDFVRFVRIK